jgi:malate dehydrogenase (quinone)
MEENHEVAIVGGGIIGTSLLYILSKFSNIESVVLLEKNKKLGQESTNSKSNAQTLHIGDIETNYGIGKVLETKMASELIPKYTATLPPQESERIIFPTSKMVLGVGEKETEFIEKRYDDKFLSIFPSIKKLNRDGINEVEPAVVKGRSVNEKISAAYSNNGSIVSFDRLAESFAAKSFYNITKVKIALDEYVQEVKPNNGAFRLRSSKSNYNANFVVLAAGGYSLYFAKSMGFGDDLSVLSIGGNFFYSKKILNGKVYRVQKSGVPFAAVHGDPDLNYPDRTRFGPTVSVLPYLENARDITTESHMRAFEDYIRTLGMDKNTIESLLNIISDKDIIEILLTNVGYSIPELGKYMFVKDEVNKIVPSLKNKDVIFDKEAGGVRPQIINKKEKKLVLGVVELKQEGIIFEMAPSPGASACLKGALEDAIEITNHLGKEFYTEEFCKVFCSDDESRKALFDSLRVKPK